MGIPRICPIGDDKVRGIIKRWIEDGVKVGDKVEFGEPSRWKGETWIVKDIGEIRVTMLGSRKMVVRMDTFHFYSHLISEKGGEKGGEIDWAKEGVEVKTKHWLLGGWGGIRNIDRLCKVWAERGKVGPEGCAGLIEDFQRHVGGRGWDDESERQEIWMMYDVAMLKLGVDWQGLLTKQGLG